MEDKITKGVTDKSAVLPQWMNELNAMGTEHKWIEERLKKINECFLSFGTDPDDNINRMVALCGECMQATCALYNRLEAGMLCSAGQWNPPLDYKPQDRPEGHICYDVIKQQRQEPLVVRNLQNSPYAKTDHNVTSYKLETYVGLAVKFGFANIGSLCVVYQRDFIPTQEDIRFMEIVACAIGVEENRKWAQQALKESQERYKHISETVTDYIFTVYVGDERAVKTIHGPACVNVTGYTPEEFAYEPDLWIRMVYEEDRSAVLEYTSRILSEKKAQPQPIEHRIVRKDGAIRWMRNTSVLHFDSQGKLISYDGLLQDITERRRMYEELNHHLEFEKLITTISSNFINLKLEDVDCEMNSALKMIGEFARVDRSYIFQVDDNQTRAEETYEWCAEGIELQIQKLKKLRAADFPWTTEKLKSREVIYARSPADLPPEAAAEKELLQTLKVKSVIYVPMVSGGSLVGFLGFDSVRQEKTWSEEDIALLKITGEIFANVLQHKQQEAALKKNEQFLSSIFGSIQDGVSILDSELNIVSVNPTMEQWYAHAIPLVGKKCYEAYHSQSQPCKVCPSLRTIETGVASYNIVPKIGTNGKIAGWLDLYAFPHIDPVTGNLKGVIEYVRDITERKDTENKLEVLNKEILKSNTRLKHLALRDPHTGLYNYRYLEEVIEAEFYRARRYAHFLSVIMLDIDYFKSINDVYGHNFGDAVLKQLARQLKIIMRRYDIVIRFGGEEFVIVSPGIDRSQAFVLAQRLLDAINLYNFGDKRHTIKLKLSLAVTSYPEDNILKGMDLINLASEILTKAKEYGGNRVYSALDIKNGENSALEKSKKNSDVKLLKGKLERLTKRANQSLVEAVFAFAMTIELKDHYTGEHVEKTVYYATEIARALKLAIDEIELIKQAAMVHDLGKIGVSEGILHKESKLSKKEFEIIKKHPQIGVDIIRPIQILHNIIPLILYHHERWDGKGYPSGLKGEEIPIGARIIALADVYQALTSDRPYRKAYSKNEVLKIIKSGSGTQFEPRIVDVFLQIIKEGKKR